MPTVRDFVRCVESIAPPELAFPNDPIGLQIGDWDAPVTKLAVSLDATPRGLEQLLAKGCDAWVVHHPLIYHPLARLTDDSYTASLALQIARSRVAVMAAHTNWDCARGGINDVLAEALGLAVDGEFGWKVDDSKIPSGRIGVHPSGMAASEWIRTIDEQLGCRCQIHSPNSSTVIRKIGLVGGAAGSEWKAARAAGCDAFLTGELKHDQIIEAVGTGFTVIQAGHYDTENPGIVRLGEKVAEALGVPLVTICPELGDAGRSLTP